MAGSTFEKTVQRYAAEQQKRENAVNWAERKTWWQGKVTELLTQIEGWLDPLIKSKSVNFIRSTISINEESLGSYEVESGVIQLGRAMLRVKPVGSVIIGGFGRVDVEGPREAVMLILCTPEIAVPDEHRRENAKWYISRPNLRRELRPLTQANFEQIFTDLFGIEG